MNIDVKQLSVEFLEDVDPAKQQKIANLVAVLSHSQLSEKQRIIPLSPEDVFQKYIAMVALWEGEFMGFVGASDPIPHEQTLLCKVGSLIVPPGYQGQGIGSELIWDVTEQLISEGKDPYAFANPVSLKAFTKIGYVPATDGQLPIGEFSPYGNTSLVLPRPFNLSERLG